jgi:hypothetical protein
VQRSHYLIYASTGTQTLEEKIILSIVIRLKAEEFLIEKINDDQFIKQIAGRGELFYVVKRFKNVLIA